MQLLTLLFCHCFLSSKIDLRGGVNGCGMLINAGAAPSSGSDNENSINIYKYSSAAEEGDDHSSQHSNQGQPNQSTSSSYHPMYAQQQKELNSLENLGLGHGGEQDKSASFIHHQGKCIHFSISGA